MAAIKLLYSKDYSTQKWLSFRGFGLCRWSVISPDPGTADPSWR